MGMRYRVVIEPVTEAACYGVAVPDLPGRFSAGETLRGGARRRRKLGCGVDGMRTLAAGIPVPPPSGFDAIINDPDYAGWICAV